MDIIVCEREAAAQGKAAASPKKHLRATLIEVVRISRL